MCNFPTCACPAFGRLVLCRDKQALCDPRSGVYLIGVDGTATHVADNWLDLPSGRIEQLLGWYHSRVPSGAVCHDPPESVARNDAASKYLGTEVYGPALIGSEL